NIYQRITSICNAFRFNGREVVFNKTALALFSLRDANFAIMNPHFKRRIDVGEIKVDILTEKHTVLEKRIKYFSNKFPKSENNGHIALFEGILQDKYLSKYFTPLYNFDYRKLVWSIFKLIEDDFKEEINLKIHRFDILHNLNYHQGA